MGTGLQPVVSRLQSALAPRVRPSFLSDPPPAHDVQHNVTRNTLVTTARFLVHEDQDFSVIRGCGWYFGDADKCRATFCPSP